MKRSAPYLDSGYRKLFTTGARALGYYGGQALRRYATKRLSSAFNSWRNRTASATKATRSPRVYAKNRVKLRTMSHVSGPLRHFRDRGLKRKHRAYRKKKYIRQKKVRKLTKTRGAEVRIVAGGVLQDSYCVTVGHSIPLQALRRAFLEAIVKLCLQRAGHNFIDPYSPCNVIKAGDSMVLYYRKNLSNANSSTPLFWLYNTVAGDTIANMATNLLALMRTTFTTNQYNNVQLTYAEFIPTSGAAHTANTGRLDLQTASVCFFYDSTLKMQNRTADSATNTNALDLVAQHLIGKSYYGFGNGTASKVDVNGAGGDAKRDIIASQDKGLITVSAQGDTNEGWWRPPPKTQFNEVISSHNVKFQPGEVKKSHLSYSKCFEMEDFMKLMIMGSYDYTVPDVGSSVNLDNCYVKHAKHRFFMLTKEIETVFNAQPATPVTVSYEVDQIVGVEIQTKGNTYMNRDNFVFAPLPTNN